MKRDSCIPFISDIPKYGAKHYTSEPAEEESNNVVIRAPPIGPPLLPKAGFELLIMGLSVLCWKV